MLINDSVSLFLDKQWYVNSVSLHKFFIDKNDSARLLLSVFHKEISLFNEFNTIDLMYMNPGHRDNYSNGTLLARIGDCEIKQKWFSELTISSRDLTDYVRLYFYIKGKIEFINWNLLNDNQNSS